MELSAAQVRAARGLLGWSQERLAQAAGVGIQTVIGLESGGRRPRQRTADAIRSALEQAGVEFIAQDGDGPGVRLRGGV